jgi:hypothetical protein
VLKQRLASCWNEFHSLGYGQGTGIASYNLPGGAIIHVSSDGDGLHMILNSADEEQRMKGNIAR